MKAKKHIFFLIFFVILTLCIDSNVISNFEVNIVTATRTTTSSFNESFYDMAIISTLIFKDEISVLIEHKNTFGTKSFFQAIEHIYSNYTGRDYPEKIKYFIKDAIETFNISYVLLVGNIDIVPIRCCYLSSQGERNFITDLYYADVYFPDGRFSSWNSNNNDSLWKFDKNYADLSPDVHIGRLACSSQLELKIVIDKIINYESSESKEWFNKMIFIGGNTFPQVFLDSPEGERINEIIIKIMSCFEPIRIYTSNNLFKPRNINRIISSSGGGFLMYSGHGTPHGFHTYDWKAWSSNFFYLRFYNNYHIRNLNNGEKLPIMFFDACSTAKLDYTKQEFREHNMLLFLYYQIFNPVELSDDLISCFAWNMVKNENGGAIATIGSTRRSYSTELYGGGKLAIEFFKAYDSNITLGEMFTNAQISYINQLPNDFLTISQFILLGDPSLKISGC